MVSTLNATGLTIQSNASIVADITNALKGIYGPDINVDSNSPDGQMINIFAQADTDLLELLLATYNLFAVPTAYGTRLDQLVALNGIARKQGTYTQAIVAVTFTAAITLPGLDQTAQVPFTVADTAGNQFELLTSYAAGAPGTVNLTFRAADIGQVQTTANTITNIVTSTLGAPSCNNPSTAADLIGVNEESDVALKIRHAQSFTLAQTGPSDAMEAALKNIPDILDAFIVENNTNVTVNGIPPYSIWPIVRGGTAVEIAAAIYAKKSPGCGLKGSVSQSVTRPNGQIFTARWDVAVAQSLFIKFSLIWNGPQILSNSDVAIKLAAALSYKLGGNPTIGDILIAMQTIAPTAIVTINSTIQGVSSNNVTWNSVVTPTSLLNYYTVSSGNITIT